MAEDAVVRCDACWQEYRVLAAVPEPPRCRGCANVLPWITRADEDSFADAVTLVASPVVVELRAAWSGPSRLVGPVLEKIARERAGLVKLVRVDVEEAPRVPRLLSVEVVPTLVVMRDGEPVARRAGAASAGTVRRWVRDVLGAPVPEPERERELVPG